MKLRQENYDNNLILTSCQLNLVILSETNIYIQNNIMDIHKNDNMAKHDCLLWELCWEEYIW